MFKRLVGYGMKGADVVTANAERLLLAALLLIIVAGLCVALVGGMGGAATLVGSVGTNVASQVASGSVPGSYSNPFLSDGNGPVGGSNIAHDTVCAVFPGNPACP